MISATNFLTEKLNTFKQNVSHNEVSVKAEPQTQQKNSVLIS